MQHICLAQVPAAPIYTSPPSKQDPGSELQLPKAAVGLDPSLSTVSQEILVLRQTLQESRGSTELQLPLATHSEAHQDYQDSSPG